MYAILNAIMRRRTFINQSALASLACATGSMAAMPDPENKTQIKNSPVKNQLPIAICTWRFEKANATAGALLDKGTPGLDAIIAGVGIEEQNLKNTTVGKGGAPDREGNVTLDACVMDHKGNCGAVVCVSTTSHVAALARKVMEETPHVMLAGEGAEEFAALMGFAKEDLLTEDSKKAWLEWKKSPEYKPLINIENHDTIGMLAIDKDGLINGACTTSGLSYKMKGRVGDSPIIGSGLFIDNAVGGAVATGMGEEVMKTVGSFLIVELMRNGMTPQEACEEAIKRITDKNKNHPEFQIAYIAIDKMGNTGSYCIHPGFTMMKYENGVNENIKSESFIKD